MDFNLDELTEDQKNIIQEINDMLIPELMGVIEIGEERLQEGFDNLLECNDDDLEDVFTQFVSDVITLRYYKQILNKRDVDNMTVGELKEEYKKFEEKIKEIEEE